MHVSTYQHIGSRQYQEDRVLVVEHFGNLQHFTLCMVCDGHGGDQTSEFLIHEYPQQLHRIFDQYRILHKKNKQREAKTSTKEDRVVRMMGVALERCISMWDEKCFGPDAQQLRKDAVFKDDNARDVFYRQHVDKKKWEREGLVAGSTLNCMIVDCKKKRAHIINIGDSRTAWIIGDKTIGQTIDHNVKRKIDPTKGLECGVIDGRLEGVLAMSHAIGDNDRELFGKVKRDYDCYMINFQGSDFRAVTATDGLFDERTNQQLLYDTYEDATDIATTALKDISLNHEIKCAELAGRGLMSQKAANAPYAPAFADNVSFVYVKIPASFTFVKKKPNPFETMQELAQSLELQPSTRKQSTKKLPVRKQSLKKKVT